MIRVMVRNLEDNSLECFTPVEMSTFRLVKLESPEKSLFWDAQADFMGYVLSVDFDCLEYKNKPEKGLPSQCYFHMGVFCRHEIYLNINGVDYHYRDILRNFGDILAIISNERVDEALKEITE